MTLLAHGARVGLRMEGQSLSEGSRGFQAERGDQGAPQERTPINRRLVLPKRPCRPLTSGMDSSSSSDACAAPRLLPGPDGVATVDRATSDTPTMLTPFFPGPAAGAVEAMAAGELTSRLCVGVAGGQSRFTRYMPEQIRDAHPDLNHGHAGTTAPMPSALCAQHRTL